MSVELINENAELRRSNAKLAASLELATTTLKICLKELKADEMGDQVKPLALQTCRETLKLLADPAACLVKHDEEITRDYKSKLHNLKRQVTYLDNTIGRYRDKKLAEETGKAV